MFRPRMGTAPARTPDDRERPGEPGWHESEEFLHGDVYLMDDRHKTRRRDRSRGGGVARGGRTDQPRRRPDGRERDGNVAPKDDVRLGKCSNCRGPAPDKTDLCRHCAGVPKPPEPADAE